MTKNKEKNINNVQPEQPPNSADDQMDTAGKALSDALRISFVILKIIMLLLIVIFLASGFKTIDSDEKAIVLRFGRIRNIGEERVLEPGLHWVWPYPIDEIITIPVKKKINLAIDDFWYYQHASELFNDPKRQHPRIPSTLNPMRDGYCLTRTEKHEKASIGFTESDYNIVHSKWQLIYRIDDPVSFFTNVYSPDIKPGQSRAELIRKNLSPLLGNLVQDVVVTTMVDYSIDQCIPPMGRISNDIERGVQKKLNRIDSGIKVDSIQLTDITWPRQVDDAFLANIKASQTSQTLISEAKSYAENTLNETAGPVADELLASLQSAEDISKENPLWDRLAGNAQQIISEARAYRTNVVESAKADAEYLHQILPEYRKHPKLVIQDIYLDAIEQVLGSTNEKMVIQPSPNAPNQEIRVLLNRDPQIQQAQSGTESQK